MSSFAFQASSSGSNGCTIFGLSLTKPDANFRRNSFCLTALCFAKKSFFDDTGAAKGFNLSLYGENGSNKTLDLSSSYLSLTDDLVYDYGDNDEDEVEEVDSFAIVSGDLNRNTTISDNHWPMLTGIDLHNFSSFSTNLSYFYLQRELGLSDVALMRVTYEAGSALGMTSANIRHKVDVLRENLDLSDEDIRVIIERLPPILHLSADKNVAPTIQFLIRSLDMSRDELRSVILACPSVLSYSIKNLQTKIKFFTFMLGLSTQECRRLLLAEPNLLRAGVRTGLVPRMRFLIREIGFTREKLRALIQKHPTILLLSLDDNLIPKLIFYLVMTLCMSTEQIQKLLLTYPAFMNYNLDHHTLPITSYFVKELEVNPHEFRGILLKFPRLVTFSLRKIKHVVGFFRYELGFTAAEVKRVLYQAPQVISLSTESNLKTKVEFLRESFDLSDEHLRKVLARMPTILLLSMSDNLLPKVVFLQSSFGGNIGALRDAVLRLPALLAYSLNNRLRPRMNAILRAGLDPSSITIAASMKDVNFDRWLLYRGAKARKTHVQLVTFGQKEAAEPKSMQRIEHWTRDRLPLRDQQK
jgi:mTERF domain-containing protein